MAETTDRHEQARIFLDWYAGMKEPSKGRPMGKPNFTENATVMLLTLGMDEFREKGYFQKGFQISLGFSPPCISDNIRDLEKEGLVERLPTLDGQDSRNKVIRLTEKGRKVYEEMVQWYSWNRERRPVIGTQEKPGLI